MRVVSRPKGTDFPLLSVRKRKRPARSDPIPPFGFTPYFLASSYPIPGITTRKEHPAAAGIHDLFMGSMHCSSGPINGLKELGTVVNSTVNWLSILLSLILDMKTIIFERRPYQ